MKIIKQKQTHWVENAPTSTVEEYLMRDDDISGATTVIYGRYPVEGYATNIVSKEIALVISGSGFVGTPKKKIALVLGDCILIKAKEKFYWEGHMTLFMASSPAWKTRQHKIVK